MASMCVFEIGTYPGNLPSIVLSCQVGKHRSARLVAKKVASVGRRQKSAGRQRACLSPWRGHSTGFGAFQSQVCAGREDHGTGKFREPAGWKACASAPEKALGRSGGSPLPRGEETCGIEP